MNDLAAELGISYQHLKNKAAQERWAQQPAEFWAKVMEKASERVAVDTASLAEEHRKITRTVVEATWPIFAEKVRELSAFEACKVIREAIELEGKPAWIEEQVRTQVVGHLELLIAVARRLLSREQFEELKDRPLEASGVM